jgi:alpha-tubulin suppressor-like RCC1 family protein
MGNNSDGRLGIGDKSLKSSNVPCLVEGLDNIVSVKCGMAHTLALKNDGSVYSWG